MKLSYILKTDCYRNHNHQLQPIHTAELVVRIIRKMKQFVLILICMLLLGLPCLGATPGDVNHADGVDLKDVIQALRVTAGIPLPTDIFTDADVNGDKKIGLEEAIYGLQVVAQLRGGSTGGDFSNSLGMAFKLIPTGTFMMGSPETDYYANSWEKPQHQV